jgi:hypothetical protein
VDGYWRQLRLYSLLISEMGNWPVTARIMAASGQVLDEPVNKAACQPAADAAISGLDAMNEAPSAGCDSASLANPSQIASASAGFGRSARRFGHGAKPTPGLSFVSQRRAER